MDEPYETCLSMLREGDRDRYLCALLMPHRHRGPVAALFAFNMEIARIRDAVSEPMVGEVRLQWWKDLIEGQAHGDPGGHPVASALLRAIDDHALPRQTLTNMIEARRFDLYDDPMPDRNTYEGYAGETASALIQLSVQILCSAESRTSAQAAGHAGVAQLTAGLLLLLPRHCARGQLYIPAEILQAAGVDRDAFLTGEDATGTEHALLAFVALGREHLRLAREAANAIAPDCLAAFLPVATADMFFARAGETGRGHASHTAHSAAMAPSDPFLERGAQTALLKSRDSGRLRADLT